MSNLKAMKVIEYCIRQNEQWNQTKPSCIFLYVLTPPLTKAKMPKNKSLLFCSLSVSHKLVNPVCVYLEFSFSYILFHTTPYQTSLSYFITSCPFLSFSPFIPLFPLYTLSSNCLHCNISLPTHYSATDTPCSLKRCG